MHILYHFLQILQFDIIFKTTFEYIRKKFVLCIQIRFVGTEKKYAHRLACILFKLELFNLFVFFFSNIYKYTCNSHNRPISQTVFMSSIAINRADYVGATVLINHNYTLKCNYKIVINIMLCLLNSTGHM